ncbi:DUF2515 family protein [Prosthecochloris sp. CIB 2401]|uniref:DUF2515 family protein n=1 Tax=Prosthecochloris sp. CIB 2401 TaxID=1868325 RepID=UPI00080A9AEE|nr:hypothetical protein [Prosthecochloris sp. CIB 2401]ANT65809.1 hypothetical protein Ptc2401_02079 [Prosthecochloris sp. CIB 2401]
MLSTRDHWNNIAASVLPPQSQAIERNRAITRAYAGLYRSHRTLFKWAGAAAFASEQVGTAITAAAILGAPGTLSTQAAGFPLKLLWFPAALFDMAARQLLLDDLEEIRKGNNSIYEDIAWAHLAYAAGGLSEIEGNCTPAEQEFMVTGFQLIDQGRQLLEAGQMTSEAEKLIWQGNILLLRQEQLNTLAPIFRKISLQGKVIASLGSELHFGQAAPPGVPGHCSFATHYGHFDILTGKRCIANAEDRWEWIEQSVLPAWSAIDRQYDFHQGATRRLLELSGGLESPFSLT